MMVDVDDSNLQPDSKSQLVCLVWWSGELSKWVMSYDSIINIVKSIIIIIIFIYSFLKLDWTTVTGYYYYYYYY